MSTNDKKFYTLKEIMKEKLLPYQSLSTLRRMIEAGHIRVMRNPTPRSYIYVTAEEVQRVRSLMGVETQDISPQLEHKSGKRSRAR